MKKRKSEEKGGYNRILWRIGIIFFLILLIFLIRNIIITGNAVNVADLNSQTGEPRVLGLNPDELPQDAQDVQDMASKYLKKEWSKIIANTSVIGPVHNFFLAHQMPFRIIFAEEYSFSLRFFLIFIIWLFIFLSLSQLMSNWIENVWYCLLIGLVVAIGFAQIKVTGIIASFIIRIFEGCGVWWKDLLVWVGIIAVLGGVSFLNNFFSQYTKEKKKEEKEKRTDKALQKIEKFEKGAGI